MPGAGCFIPAILTTYSSCGSGGRRVQAHELLPNSYRQLYQSPLVALTLTFSAPAQKLGDSDELWNALDGIFACVLLDEATGEFCAARDPIGVCSFYWGRGGDGSVWFASEMKALQAHCVTFDIFPPVRGPHACLGWYELRAR